MTALSFVGFLVVFVVVGLLSHRHARTSLRSYLLSD